MPFPRVSLVIAILAAVVASQLPEFAQQYRQRLGGAIDELQLQVSRFEGEAQANGVTWQAAIDRLQKNADDLARRHATDMEETRERLERLIQQRDSFQQAGSFTRILVMVRDFDPLIARRALSYFEPAVPTTSEGLVSTLVGFFFGGGLIRLLAMPFRRRDPLQSAYATAASGSSRSDSIRLRQRTNKYSLPSPRRIRDQRDA